MLTNIPVHSKFGSEKIMRNESEKHKEVKRIEMHFEPSKMLNGSSSENSLDREMLDQFAHSRI